MEGTSKADVEDREEVRPLDPSEYWSEEGEQAVLLVCNVSTNGFLIVM